MRDLLDLASAAIRGGAKTGAELANDILKTGAATGAQGIRRTGGAAIDFSKLGISAASRADVDGSLLKNLVDARTAGAGIDEAAEALGKEITSKFADELVSAKVFDDVDSARAFLTEAKIETEVVQSLKEGANPRTVTDAAKANGLTKAASQSPEAAARAISKTIDDTLPAATKPAGGWPIGKIIGWALAAGIASAILIPALVRFIEKKNYRGKVQRIVFTTNSEKIAIHYAPSIQLNGKDQIGLLNVRDPVQWLGEGEDIVNYSQTPSTSAQTSITAQGTPRDDCGSKNDEDEDEDEDAAAESCGDMRIEPDFATELGQAAHDLFRGIANILGGALGGFFAGNWWIWVLVTCGIIICIVITIFVIRAMRKQ